MTKKLTEWEEKHGKPFDENCEEVQEVLREIHLANINQLRELQKLCDIWEYEDKNEVK